MATVIVTVSRDQLIRDQQDKGRSAQFMKAGGRILHELRAAGVPIVGAIGLFGVEQGSLTLSMDDGLDGDEFVYTYVGELVPAAQRGKEFTFSNPMPKPIEEDDEL